MTILAFENKIDLAAYLSLRKTACGSDAREEVFVDSGEMLIHAPLTFFGCGLLDRDVGESLLLRRRAKVLRVVGHVIDLVLLVPRAMVVEEVLRVRAMQPGQGKPQ